MEPLAVWDDVVLRRATAADLPQVVGLLRDDPLAAAREVGDLAPYIAAFADIDADPAHLLLVAVSGPGVLAVAQLSFLPGLTYGGGTRAQIEGVRVRADSRGRGLGARMVDRMVREARRRDCVLVQLTSDSARTDALRFYSRLGFEPSHTGFKLALRGPERSPG